MLSLILINSVFNYQVLDQLQIKRPAFLRNCLLNLRYHYVAVGIVFLHWNSQSPIEWFFPQKMHWYFPNMESFESSFSISAFFSKMFHSVYTKFDKEIISSSEHTFAGIADFPKQCSVRGEAFLIIHFWNCACHMMTSF